MIAASFVIDDGFRSLLVPLSALEFTHLEQSILAEGCRDKLIVWREENTLVDGHNRFEICTANNLPFEVEYFSFANRDAVCDWIDKNQLGRRNVTPDDYKIITGRIYNRRKKPQGGDHKSKDQIDTLIDVAEQVAEELGVSAPTVKRDGKRAEVYDKLVDAGQVEAAEIVKSAPQRVIEEVKNDKPEVIAEKVKKPHVSNNSGEQDWYTPVEFIESARKVLGEIQLDPASSDVAQSFVKATCYYSKEDDGLVQDWSGNVWLNPPYASGLVERFAEKLVEAIDCGSVRNAIVLVNNATDTRWFHLLANHSDALCFVRGRIKFLDATGEPRNTPLQGQTFLYYGVMIESFVEEFSAYGFCVRKL